MIKEITFKISGMHCTGCAFGIDGEMEDTEGVLESNTSYPRQETKVKFDDAKVAVESIVSIFKKIGYEAKRE